MSKETKRLTIKQETIKKLFAYSGNQCAMPDCTAKLVHKSGTMLGKIAHICAAEKGGARFDPKMTDEERRSFDNLFIVCGKHHDIIDDKNNLKDYPTATLKKHKQTHENRFKQAERQLIQQFTDTTQITQPTYPKNLRALANALNVEGIADHPDEIKGTRHFISSLKELPLAQREFAIKLALRMHRNKSDELLVEEVEEVFNISSTNLKRHMRLLEKWRLGGIDEGNNYQEWFVRLYEKKVGGNPWFEIIDFCEATSHTHDEFIYDLNFALYDE